MAVQDFGFTSGVIGLGGFRGLRLGFLVSTLHPKLQPLQ